MKIIKLHHVKASFWNVNAATLRQTPNWSIWSNKISFKWNQMQNTVKIVLCRCRCSDGIVSSSYHQHLYLNVANAMQMRSIFFLQNLHSINSNDERKAEAPCMLEKKKQILFKWTEQSEKKVSVENEFAWRTESYS